MPIRPALLQRVHSGNRDALRMVESTSVAPHTAGRTAPGRRRRLSFGLAGFLAGMAVAVPLSMVSRGEAHVAPQIDRRWTTTEVARYLGLGDASSFGSGVACEVYIQDRRPYDWVVSLCHH